ncbi:motility associated factor glycosyltransferase family protein [Shewanella cyperi]|uniref:Motility associated factor glycosyltransferase family protein n=1 Tax=Shewanella cyperi TaxID=2814292 RepID=A0A974XIG3_9GAMM|nr:6-hydroxymethylpterin diphosphokinase MptE-like protein [Shewanella cyperi]QSX28986.1 motility associated factor glycosyltransferase family protein [Shewanella cyperi]
MTDLLQQNMAIIRRRWPEVAQAMNAADPDSLDAMLVTGAEQTISVNGIQLSSRHNRLAEAELLINQLPANCREVTLYGVGMGDVPSLLIHDPRLQRISVCPLNLHVFVLLLTYTDQSEWLSEPRVELVARPQQLVLAPCYIAITPDLLLISDENARLRDLVVFHNNLDFANKRHRQNDKELEQRLADNFEIIKRDPDAASLSSVYQPTTTLVIGTGPTLEQHYPYLRAQRALPPATRPLMIAADTAFKALINEQIVPDIVVTVDHNIAPTHFPDTVPTGVKLVYFPKSHPQVLQSWPGERFAAYSLNGSYDELNSKCPRLRLFANGSVIHPAIDLAVYLESKNIILFGCDFSYPKNKTHAYWPEGKLGPKITGEKHHWVINGHGEKVVTHLNFRGYLLALEHYIRTKPQVTFYNSSLEGAAIEGTLYQECKI